MKIDFYRGFGAIVLREEDYQTLYCALVHSDKRSASFATMRCTN